LSQALPQSASAFVNGVRFDALDRGAIRAAIESGAQPGESKIIRFCATHPVFLARSDRAYRDLLNEGDLTIPDGIGPALAVRALGGPFNRTPGVEAMQDALRSTSLRHFFFGGTPEILEEIERRVADEPGGSVVAGVYAPPFRPLTYDEWADAATQMRESEADVVWVGLGVPKQDFAADKLRRMNVAPVICCVGAAFDFYAGSKRRAPRLVRALALEWIYRLVQEPSRLWQRYLVGNTLFVYDFLLERVSSRRTRAL
jgi:N-acetylglucosaminyldiphosphoundecaprenol N-acetyl-beta-D-mannosaminyltransferase